MNADVLKRLVDDGFIRNPVRYDENAVTAEFLRPIGSTAKESAKHLRGQVMPLERVGIVNIVGRNTPTYVLKASALNDSVKAGLVADKLGVRTPTAYTVGKVAREILKTLPTQNADRVAERVAEHYGNGFFLCEPGDYVSRETKHIESPHYNLFTETHYIPNPEYTPAFTLWDAKSYYYNLLKRFNSWHVIIDGGGYWETVPLCRADERRRQEVLDIIGENKPLRNALVGAMGGNPQNPRTAWTSSKCEPGQVRRVKVPGKPGTLRPLALLVRRVGAEITHRQALTLNARYATIDSIGTESRDFPDFLACVGEVEKKAEGDAAIIALGSWKVGEKSTETYDAGMIYRCQHLPPSPSFLYSAPILERVA